MKNSGAGKGLIVIVILLMMHSIHAQSVSMIKSDFIVNLKQSKSDTVYVINFWATWCKPCVEELPAFEKLNELYKNKKVKLIMVSNDFKKQINSRLIPFIIKKKLKSAVAFMDESNPNDWIDKVDKSWSGAIPATLIICGKKNFLNFNEGETTFDALEKIILPLTEK